MSIQQLTREQHASLRVRPIEDYAFLGNIHYLPLLVTEFLQACIEFPIVFLKHADTGRFQAVAMFGLARGSNAFVDGGRWTGLYLPAVARQAPFRLIASTEQPDRLYLGIDTAHDTVSDADGEALFDADGKETAYLERRKKALFEYAEHMQLSQAFVDLLVRHELLRETTLTYGPDGKNAAIAGLYVIDEKRLNALPAETFIELRDRGFISVAYAHLVSLQQVRRLAAAVGARAAD